MSDYFHEQMVNKMLEPKERDFPCKECFIFKIEEERVNQFIANYKAQRTLFRNAEVVKALEDVRAEINKEIEDKKEVSHLTIATKTYMSALVTCRQIIERKIKEIKHE